MCRSSAVGTRGDSSEPWPQSTRFWLSAVAHGHAARVLAALIGRLWPSACSRGSFSAGYSLATVAIVRACHILLGRLRSTAAAVCCAAEPCLGPVCLWPLCACHAAVSCCWSLAGGPLAACCRCQHTMVAWPSHAVGDDFPPCPARPCAFAAWIRAVPTTQAWARLVRVVRVPPRPPLSRQLCACSFCHRPELPLNCPARS
jgi:hypothetical protein